MASVDDTVRKLLLTYPSLYDSRTKVLDMLIGAYGTGYEWVNGELVNTLGEHELDPDRDHGEYFQRQAESTPSIAKEMQELANEYRERGRYNAEHIDDLVHTKSDLYYARGFGDDIHKHVSKYSPCNNVPDDVTADWAAAVEEWREADRRRIVPPLHSML